MMPVASESYITAAASEKPSPEAAISGRPKKPVLPTAVATISAPARGRSIPHTRAETTTAASMTRCTAQPATGTSSSDPCRSAFTRMVKISGGSAR